MYGCLESVSFGSQAAGALAGACCWRRKPQVVPIATGSRPTGERKRQL